MEKFIVVFILLTNMALAQDLEIEIPSSKIVLRSENRSNLCYKIKNNSTKYYKILADSTGFSTAENEVIDEPYLGLLNLRIFDGEQLLAPISGSHAYEKNPKEINPTYKELITFKDLHQLNPKNISELYIFYKIYYRSIYIPPKKSTVVCTKISLPIYNSAADDGSLFYDIKSKREYDLQLHLNIPSKMLKKYSIVFNQGPKKYKIFSGEIISNKVSIILKDE